MRMFERQLQNKKRYRGLFLFRDDSEEAKATGQFRAAGRGD